MAGFVLNGARAAIAAAGSREPSRVASRPSGFDPSRKHIYIHIHNVSLAGGTRSRAPPALRAGAAHTVPRSGALLTGLATALGPGSRRYASALC